MLELHHFGFSTCSQKVRLVLAEKRLEFESREVNLITGEQHAPEYVALNPKHVVPTLVHDGRVVLESSLIIRYLDEVFPEPAMRPDDAFGRYEVDRWIKRVDDAIHVAAPTVTFALGPRLALLQQPDEIREANIAKIPDPDDRARRRSVLEHGVAAPEFAAAFGVFVGAIDDMERDLARAEWISGERFGLADATLLPYVLRLEHLGLDPLLEPVRRPRLADWLGRVKARPAYATAVDAWSPAAVVEGMRAAGRQAWPEIEKLLDA